MGRDEIAFLHEPSIKKAQRGSGEPLDRAGHVSVIVLGSHRFGFNLRAGSELSA